MFSLGREPQESNDEKYWKAAERRQKMRLSLLWSSIKKNRTPILGLTPQAIHLSPVPGLSQHIGGELFERVELDIGGVVAGVIEEMGRRNRDHPHPGGYP